jgi:hypothetical protein
VLLGCRRLEQQENRPVPERGEGGFSCVSVFVEEAGPGGVFVRIEGGGCDSGEGDAEDKQGEDEFFFHRDVLLWGEVCKALFVTNIPRQC